jgi:hypothetical protein
MKDELDSNQSLLLADQFQSKPVTAFCVKIIVEKKRVVPPTFVQTMV